MSAGCDVLGLDLSLRNCGWVIVAPSRFVLRFGVIETPAPTPKKKRASGQLVLDDMQAVRVLRRDLARIVSGNPGLAFAVIENPEFAKQVRTAQTFCYARAAVSIALEDAGLPCEWYSPRECRAAATGSEKATDEQAYLALAAAFVGTEAIVRIVPPRLLEHAMDALAVVAASSKGALAPMFWSKELAALHAALDRARATRTTRTMGGKELVTMTTGPRSAPSSGAPSGLSGPEPAQT